MSTPPPHFSHPKYRPDIDGLRAVAVLSVVAFHAFPDRVKGGFIGVDVFFVISGFLISTIVFENLEQGTFSFRAFYARRIRRIFPALLLVLAVACAAGWFLLFADEYKQLGKHTAAGAGFVSNYAFWREAGYFDNAADTKPLLHLWSLGIEEQFYIVWPLFLWLAWKSRFNLAALIGSVALVSFVLNVQGVRNDAVAAFYSPQTRFWELLCGGLLAWLALYGKGAPRNAGRGPPRLTNPATARQHGGAEPGSQSSALSVIGCLLLAFGFWRIDKDVGFPGAWAVVPVLGAALLILAGPAAWFNRTILSHRLAVWFGLISFPLYLWHWPLLSFARIVEGETPRAGIRIGLVALSVLLAWLTYRFVERPARRGPHGNVKVAALVVLMVMIGGAGFYTYSSDGLSFRRRDREEFIRQFENSFPQWTYLRKLDLTAQWRSECAYFDLPKYLEEGKLEGGVANSRPRAALDPSCYRRDPAYGKSVLVWGDSHAQALAPGLAAHMPAHWQVLQVATSGCRPRADIAAPSGDSQCRQSNHFALRTIREAAPDVVVIAHDRGHSAAAMADVSRTLKGLGAKRVLFLGPAPHWTSDLPKIIARRLWLTKPQRTHAGVDRVVMERNARIGQELAGTDTPEFVDVIGLFCDSGGCLTHTGDDLEESITTWDYGHLTPSASRYLARHLLVERIVGR